MTTYLWEKIDGPGVVTFIDETSLTTDVSFSDSGVYVLRLTVDYNGVVSYDEIVIYVLNMCEVPGDNPVLVEQNN